jgi:hypothetical protein
VERQNEHASSLGAAWDPLTETIEFAALIQKNRAARSPDSGAASPSPCHGAVRKARAIGPQHNTLSVTSRTPG